jgi:hypothetical protein
MINPIPRAKELYQEYVDESMTCDVKPTWEQLDINEKAKWMSKAVAEWYHDND